jgi:hypothetical protein
LSSLLGVYSLEIEEYHAFFVGAGQRGSAAAHEERWEISTGSRLNRS